MNKTILMGRLTREPDVKYSQGENAMCITRYTLAVDRGWRGQRRNNNDQPTADFIPCVVFGKSAEFAEKYFHKGTKIAITGRIQTGSYTNKEGQKVYTTEVVVEDQEFAESKNASGAGQSAGDRSQNNGSAQNSGNTAAQQSAPVQDNDLDGFMNLPEDVDEELPFA